MWYIVTDLGHFEVTFRGVEVHLHTGVTDRFVVESDFQPVYFA